MRERGRALVLGATGHLGQAVVRELRGRGVVVSAATRQVAPPSLDNLGVRVVSGDADHPGQLEAWIDGHDLVIDAAAPHPLGMCPPGHGEARDPAAHARQRTRTLLDAVARSGAALAFISSFTTLPRADRGPSAIAASWRRSVYPYFGVKTLMEDMVLDAARQGLPAVVVNPTACLGPWETRAVDSSFVRMVLAGRLPVVMGHVLNVIDVRDVAAGVLAALAARRYGVQIALTGHNIALDDLARRVGALAGVPSPLRTDPGLASVVAFWAETAWALTGRQAPAVLRAVPLIADGRAMEPGAEQRALGLPVRPLEETLRDSVQWHLGRRR